MRIHLLVGCLWLAGSSIPANTSAGAEPHRMRVESRAQLVQALRAAAPGTTILMAPGVYPGGLHQRALRGTAERPILIVAADETRPPVISGGNTCLQLSDPAYVELRNLIFENARSNGLNIDDAGDKQDPAHHVVLSGLVVRNIGPSGNRDGIKLSGLDDFRVENCKVQEWGDGGSGIDLVGCHDGTISGCTFRRQDRTTEGNAVQCKGGSRDIVVSRCHFEQAGGRSINVGGSTGAAFFRPANASYEAKDVTVQDCTFIGSMAPVAFVGVDGAIFRHNTIYRPTRWVMRILQESRHEGFVPSRNGLFTHNVIAFRSDELNVTANVGPRTSPESFRFEDNVWYCLDRPTQTRRLVRLPVEEQRGTYGTNPHLRDPESGDLHVDLPDGLQAGVRAKSP